MFILDSHNHLGECSIFGMDFSEEALLSSMQKCGVEGAILQPFPGCKDVASTHDRIYALSQKYPGKVFGNSSVNPHAPRDTYINETKRAIQDLGFKAIKLHTIGHVVNPLSADGRFVMETAKELKVPVCMHTGTGIPFSLPSLAIPLAKDFPHPIILLHSGGGWLSAEAIVVAQQCENIYLETSWCAPSQILGAIKAIGSSRVMFGSDSLINLENEINKFTSLGLTDAQLEDVFHKTAQTAYSL